MQPVDAIPDALSAHYWDALNSGLGAAATLRFSSVNSLRIRYSHCDRVRTNFQQRFANCWDLIHIYAMATRQSDVLTEYMCLFRVLEGGDGQNGKKFIADNLSKVATHDFGELHLVDEFWWEGGQRVTTNVFEVYRYRAKLELARLAGADVPGHLYALRNGLAHGKQSTIASPAQSQYQDVVLALPIVKLLARLAVEAKELSL